MESLKEKILNWMITGETGISSETMACHLAGLPKPRMADHPYDPGDLGRCIRLLEAIPELRELLPAMKTASPVWAAMVERWEELEGAYRNERSGIQTNPTCYELMQSCRFS